MALAPRLEIKQSQSLAVTPQLRQAIGLLQMNNLELNEFVEQALKDNPLLEREDDFLQEATDEETKATGGGEDGEQMQNAGNEEEFASDFDEQSYFDDAGSDAEGYSEFDDITGKDYYRKNTAVTADEAYDFFSERLSGEKSLYDVVGEQIDLHFTKPADRLLAAVLTEHIDAAGYFVGEIQQLAAKLQVKVERLEKILTVMKNFEPTGIFAQSLSECLELQLREQNLWNEPTERLLANLQLVADRKYGELTKICNCTQEKLTEMLKCIRRLNPKPAAGWAGEFNTYIIPDVNVHRLKGSEYRVELNASTLPRVLINRRYFAMLRGDKKAARYLRDNLGKASFLVKALHSRATAILRVAEEIVLRQYHFLEKGIAHLKPMTLKDVAGALELSESTVSRVTTNKYMATPRGIFEMKYFFSTAAGSYLGEDDTSTTAIKHKIKQMIDAENKEQILSDEKIVELLENEGVKIARRTVAKYREAMGIATSARRKRQKRG